MQSLGSDAPVFHPGDLRSAAGDLLKDIASAQGCGGVTIPRGVVKTCTHGSLEHGLVALVVLG